MALIVPLPFVVKRKLFAFISESPVIAKLQYGLKVRWSTSINTTNINRVLDYFHLHPHSIH